MQLSSFRSKSVENTLQNWKIEVKQYSLCDRTTWGWHVWYTVLFCMYYAYIGELFSFLFKNPYYSWNWVLYATSYSLHIHLSMFGKSNSEFLSAMRVSHSHWQCSYICLDNKWNVFLRYEGNVSQVGNQLNGRQNVRLDPFSALVSDRAPVNSTAGSSVPKGSI